MQETVRTLWLNTMSECATVHMVMSMLTGLSLKSNDHAQIGKSMVNRERADHQKTLNYFADNILFRFCDPHKLVSLSSGVLADSGNIELLDRSVDTVQQ